MLVFDFGMFGLYFWIWFVVDFDLFYWFVTVLGCTVVGWVGLAFVGLGLVGVLVYGWVWI